MDNDSMNSGEVREEDLIDALADTENAEALEMLTLYYDQEKGPGADIAKEIKTALMCAEMLYKAKRYEDVVAWLDEIATRVSDENGPDSEEYMEFAENEKLEELRSKATDRMFGYDEEEEDEDDEDYE